MRLFTLEEGHWYAVEFLGDEFFDMEGYRHSPIKILSIQPLKRGKRLFGLNFYHANYPQGVQGKSYKLETIDIGMRFLLAKSVEHDPKRIMHIHHINWTWLQSHFGDMFQKQIEENWSIDNFLNRNC